MGIQVDDEGRQLAPCGKCLLPPFGFGCSCPVLPQQKTLKGAESVEAMKDMPRPEPPPPKPAPVREPKYTPPPKVERSPLVVLRTAIDEKLGELLALARAKGTRGHD